MSGLLVLIGLNGPRISAGRVRLHVQGVQLAGRAEVENHDGTTFRRCLWRPRPSLAAPRTSTSVKTDGAERADLQEIAARDAVASGDRTFAGNFKHLKKKIAALGLTANMGALRTNPAAPLADSIKDARKQIDNAKYLSLEYLLTFGVDKPEHYEDYYRLMADAAAYSQERGLKLVLKPHGGGSGAAEEILRCLDKVKHPNFKIWYDAGNIIYYTGKDPVEQLKPIAQHVTGFCAKDCDKPKGDVMIQFGTGKVDFKAVFSELKSAGFNGPLMVECCALSDKPEEVTANAGANREFLEKVLASI